MTDRNSPGSNAIAAYAPLSARAGDTLPLHVSAPDGAVVTARLVRLRGPWAPDGPPDGAVATEATATTRFIGVRREAKAGSYGRAPAPTLLQRALAVKVAVTAQPTKPGGREQILIAFGHALRLGLDAQGRPFISAGAARAVAEAPAAIGDWIRIEGVSEHGKLGVASSGATVWAAGSLDLSETAEVTFAAGPDGDACFDGRLEAPRIEARVTAHGPWVVAAAWDFSREIGADRIVDLGPERRHGRLRNQPTRAVPGSGWRKRAFAWGAAPEEYAAIHFHGDDLDDCGWPVDARLPIPEHTESGAYMVELEANGTTDRPVVFVRPRLDGAKNPVAFLAPTYTYLAYANAPAAMRAPAYGYDAAAGEARIAAAAFYGRSLYERHDDQSGVIFSSRLRPILSLRPDLRPWGLAADLHLLGWLERDAPGYDVLTDEDLEREGLAALNGYQVVVTGNHPEYATETMLDALEAFVDAGGRLIYLGGNGFYWRTEADPAFPGRIEVRRAEDGTRPWIPEPGESHHAFSGAYGGLWRRLGRPPNRLLEVGYAAQGFDGRGGYYRIAPEARDGPAGFALAGLAGDTFGDFGLCGGAAQQEIDRFDLRNGSSAEAILIASSEGHDPSMLRAKEELLSHLPHRRDAKARSDVVLRPRPGGGAVFSAGSMGWALALSHNGYDNPVRRISANVLARFLDPTPIA